MFYLTLSSSRSYQVGSLVSITDEDILGFNGSEYSLVFDGSDVGLSGNDIDAFYWIDPASLLISVDKSVTIDGFGQVDEQDILLFTASSLGGTTSGTWSMYFDGSDVGMDHPGEDIDAIFLRPDGSILLSTNGNFSVPGATGSDEDIFLFTPSSLGETTAGTWLLYFEGADVGIDDIDGLHVSDTGEWFISTTGSITVGGLLVDDEDIFTCIPQSLGVNTICEVQLDLYFDGSNWGIEGHDINGFSIR